MTAASTFDQRAGPEGQPAFGYDRAPPARWFSITGRVLFHRMLVGVLCLTALPLSASATSTQVTARPVSRVERALSGAARVGASTEALAAARARVEPGDGPFDYAYVEDAGDLDGDGLSDLLDIRDHGIPEDQLDGWTVIHYTTTVVALRGRDAKPLWSRTFAQDEFVVPIRAKVGPTGKRGVIFAVYANFRPGGLGVGDAGLTLLALDAKGTEVWNRAIPGAYASACALVACAGPDAYPVLEDTFDALQGPALDLLVGVVSQASGAAAWVDHERFLIVNGVDGALTDTGVAGVTPNGYVGAAAVPDLDHNGKPDFVVLAGDAEAKSMTVTAYDSAGGEAIWTTAVASYRARRVLVVGDTNGDRVPDLAVTDYYAYAGDDSATAHLIDGKTGARRWSKHGRAVALGDINRDRRADVALLRYGTKGQASVRAEVYDNGGKLRWAVSRSLPEPSSGGSASPSAPPGDLAVAASSPSATAFIGLGGDMNADGVPDLGFSVTATPQGKTTRRDEGWIDGRTGRVRRDPTRDLVMLDHAVDGRGTDTVATTTAGGRLTVIAHAGDTGRLLWRVSVPLAAGSGDPFGRLAVHLSGRRCADVLVSVAYGNTTTQTIAFRGSSGLPLWSISRDGRAGAAKVTRPSARSHTDRNRCH